MKLSHELGKIFEEEMNIVIQKEIDNPNYLPQSDFETCEERAAVMVKDACVSVIKTLAVSIGKHREGDHSEDHKKEIDSLAEDLTDDQMQVGVMSWWNN